MYIRSRFHTEQPASRAGGKPPAHRTSNDHLTLRQAYTAAVDRGRVSSTAGWASITIITVQLLKDAGLQVHMFIVIVVATYRHINEEMLPDFFRKFIGKTRPCAQTILYRFR